MNIRKNLKKVAIATGSLGVAGVTGYLVYKNWKKVDFVKELDVLLKVPKTKREKVLLHFFTKEEVERISKLLEFLERENHEQVAFQAIQGVALGVKTNNIKTLIENLKILQGIFGIDEVYMTAIASDFIFTLNTSDAIKLMHLVQATKYFIEVASTILIQLP